MLIRPLTIISTGERWASCLIQQLWETWWCYIQPLWQVQLTTTARDASNGGCLLTYTWDTFIWKNSWFQKAMAQPPWPTLPSIAMSNCFSRLHCMLWPLVAYTLYLSCHRSWFHYYYYYFRYETGQWKWLLRTRGVPVGNPYCRSGPC